MFKKTNILLVTAFIFSAMSYSYASAQSCTPPASGCGGTDQWSCISGQCRAPVCGDGICNDCSLAFSPCTPRETNNTCPQDCAASPSPTPSPSQSGTPSPSVVSTPADSIDITQSGDINKGANNLFSGNIEYKGEKHFYFTVPNSGTVNFSAYAYSSYQNIGGNSIDNFSNPKLVISATHQPSCSEGFVAIKEPNRLWTNGFTYPPQAMSCTTGMGTTPFDSISASGIYLVAGQKVFVTVCNASQYQCTGKFQVGYKLNYSSTGNTLDQSNQSLNIQNSNPSASTNMEVLRQQVRDLLKIIQDLMARLAKLKLNSKSFPRPESQSFSSSTAPSFSETSNCKVLPKMPTPGDYVKTVIYPDGVDYYCVILDSDYSKFSVAIFSGDWATNQDMMVSGVSQPTWMDYNNIVKPKFSTSYTPLNRIISSPPWYSITPTNNESLQLININGKKGQKIYISVFNTENRAGNYSIGWLAYN